MTLPGILRPVLDAFAPDDPHAPGRRIRNTAIWLAIAAWMLPAYAPLGTGTVANRACICAAFVAAAVTAHFRARYKWARAGFVPAAAAAAAIVLVASGGSVWGLAFGVFSALVIGASAARRRFVTFPDPPDDPDPLPPAPRLVPRILGAYAWIGCSVLVVTAWAGQLMMVPTGSMQPTIMGARQVAGELRSGDYLFVDNFSYLFREPERWEIVVFEFPLFRERYFVKRLVGLPGEHVEIRGGDIWIDGKIARKPPLVQHTMWQEVFPRATPGSSPKRINDGFQADDSNWKRVSDTELRRRAGTKEAFVESNLKLESHDLRLAFTAVPDAGARVVARITSRGVHVRFEFETGDGGPAALTVGKEKHALDAVGARAGEDVRVELCVADGEAWATVDGREVARAPAPLEGTQDKRVEIGSAVADVSVRDIVVARDIYYRNDGGPAAYDVPKDGFFFLGDNVAQSDDSRKWAVDVIRTGSAEFRAPANLITEMGQPGAKNVRQDGANWTFLDVDGAARTVPREGTTIESVASPFARRGHLVGRAIMILFPWTRAEAGFRPRLLP